MTYFAENCSVSKATTDFKNIGPNSSNIFELQLYLNECLNYPISTRCSELARLIDCGSIKDLHDFYPTLIKSIFSAPGESSLAFISHAQDKPEFDFIFHLKDGVCVP